MNRREMMIRSGAAAASLGLLHWPQVQAANSSSDTKRRILFFSKSSGFEHSVIKKTGDKPSYAENILTELGQKHNFEFTFSKDGSLFNPEYLDKFDAFFFYTTGDLTKAGTDKNPPMSEAGKQAFLDAIHNGKGFIGTHSAADTCHSPGGEGHGDARYVADGDKADPYVKMLGAEFIIHGAQQKSKMVCVDPKFPGLAEHKDGFELTEEWYSLKNFADNLHVILLQDTEGMKGNMYQRGPYPETWARMHGKGRVFYTSMGHREDVWTNPIFQDVLVGGLSWAVQNVDADVTPNIEKVAPKASEMPPKEPPKPAKEAPKPTAKEASK